MTDTDDFDKQWEADGKAAADYAAKHCLTLKKIKYFAAGSEETNCFAADIYKGRFRIGEARNDGHGGSTIVRVDGLDSEGDKHMERWVDDTLEKYLRDKEMAKIEKWIAKNVATNTYKCFNTAVVHQGFNISLVPTKLTTEAEFREQHQKYAKADKIEIRR